MTASITIDERLDRLAMLAEKLEAERLEREEQWKLEAERRELEAERRERESERRRLESERGFAEFKNELEKSLKKVHDAHAEAEKSLKKVHDAHAETEKSLKEVSDAQKKTDEIVGNLGGRFGVLVELLVIPGVCSVLNEYGHNFNRTTPNFKLKKGAIHTQVDLMLYDTTEAMAVEIKSRLDRNDVRQHLDRLKKLRLLEEEFFIKGRTLFGAVAAITYDDGSKEMARDNGLYIIEIRETEDTLTAEQPEAGKIGKW